ncbi:MAG: hypothetical protein R2764_16895 [Bacteroidales bacterium]
MVKNKERIPIPTMEESESEDNEVNPYLIFSIKDRNGNVVKLTKEISEGINRTNWNLRYPGTSPVSIKDGKYDPLSMGRDGMLVLPGTYTVSLSQFVRGEITELTGPVEFVVKSLDNATLAAEDARNWLLSKTNWLNCQGL